ncbi:CubicO group peptidase, beta-lactamase class C family [Chitinophaga sp. CF118]|uniref:serine hydrolase domain-containing protein n=1 Tax=Chitinophaga sp. CF118 TaxID=1884367 RepID=UPI0008E5FEF0|nr:serine hydrolase domain-containing protein [Chitinophaga sp. CF118]SFD74939.1 CubicO group peptidase, beta-lactamase class C family [Chitinophaga sp. CF118]
MKIYYYVLGLLLSSLSGIAQNTPDSLQTNIDSLFSAYTRPGSPGVAVLIVEKGKVVFEKGYGMANLEYDIPVTPTTVFDIASVSKQFTGFAISTLIQEGKISPDDDIHKYLPDVPQFGKTITIRNLIHHTSGLRDWPATLHTAGWRWDEGFRYEDIMRMVKQQRELNFDPGSQYSYSNTGYNLLAAIVAKVSGKTFPEWIDEHIFKPLNMNSSQVCSDYSKVIRHLASSYYPNGNEYNKSNDALTAYGSSSIFTTIEDLSKWVIHFQQALDEKDPVYLRMIETDELNNKQKINYAYGLEVTNNNGVRNISHDGGWAGFRTIVSNYPDQKVAIILLSNYGDFDPYVSTNAIARLFLRDKIAPGQKREDLSSLPTVNVDTLLLKKYTGSYQLGVGWYVTFTLENGHIMVQANGEDKFATDLKSDTVLWVPDYHSSVTFRDIKDKAGALKYRNIIAKRVIPVKVDLSQLNQYAGTYYSEELETAYRLSVENGKLVAHHMRLGDFNFEPDMVVTERFSSSNGTINFFKDEQNKVTSFRLSSGRIKNILFNKQK